MKLKQQGFTLIELVVVIIILGILAVTAAPKFINFQGDARESALQGLKGGIQGANSILYSKAAFSGNPHEATTVELDNGVDVILIAGYMRATKASLEAGMDSKFDVLADPQLRTGDWIIDTTAATNDAAGKAKIYAHGSKDTCSLTYTEATATTSPDYTFDTSGC
ncbi:type II secretion system protein [Parashewanella spongiae]|uniref:Type II secretion system protein n=1 Tax=Parashewanella spongiae TaxID=342950 RepID=A0A3A6TZY5_9GAMM|nr:type II secretion system protein [Parashewanella spongiae]MCL1078245.1 type II secretion system GspH family protein [Parashewanella spongiae]RJY15106.1 type II secretion system protein [Parashewanella spongiae]